MPGAPALLDQHVSHLAAGAPVPLHLPQRRDQHGARQRELDVRARSRVLASPFFETTSRRFFPIISPDGSDSAALDNAVELLALAGRELPHVMAMLIPEAWDADSTMNPEKRAFYEYHASLMEPWDGPAAVAFTDGRVIGATLDRNGLRPARYLVTNDDVLIMASETGVLPIKPEDVKYKGRLQPGKMLLVDLEQKRIVPDEEIKQKLASRQPYGEWLKENQITLDKLPEPSRVHGTDSRLWSSASAPSAIPTKTSAR